MGLNFPHCRGSVGLPLLPLRDGWTQFLPVLHLQMTFRHVKAYRCCPERTMMGKKMSPKIGQKQSDPDR